MMDIWNTPVGVIILGAVGSMLAIFILTIVKFIISKIGIKALERIAYGLLDIYALNKHFVKLCEQNQRYDLILLKYQMIMSKFTRCQITFVFTFLFTFTIWIQYILAEISIIAPILLTLWTFRELYGFIRWYVATVGCFPSDFKKYESQIKELMKKDKYKFIENALNEYTSEIDDL